MTNPLWPHGKHFICPILYDICGYHDLYVVRISGRATPCVRRGGHASFYILRFLDLHEVPLLPRPPPVEDPLVRRRYFATRRFLHTLLFVARRLFAQCFHMPHEVVPVRELRPRCYIFHEVEPYSLCPQYGSSYFMFHEMKLYPLCFARKAVICCISRAKSLRYRHSSA